MTPKRLKERYAELGIDRKALARLLGVNERTLRRHENGQLPIPKDRAIAIESLRPEEKDK